MQDYRQAEFPLKERAKLTARRLFDRQLFRFYYEQNWLELHEAKIHELLTLASGEEQKEFILELLRNFEYVTDAKQQLLLNSLANRICFELNLDHGETQIVTTVYDNDPDSSQQLLQMIKSKLPALGGTNLLLKSKGLDAIKYIEERPNIVVVDEFSGSGQTIISRIKSLQTAINDKARSKGITIKLRIVVCLLAAMQKALAAIRAENIEVHSELELLAGISERSLPKAVGRKIALMQEIETRLDQNRMNPFPTLGYGQAETLYALHKANVPNSNFPILWWRHLSDGTDFDPLLERLEPNYEY